MGRFNYLVEGVSGTGKTSVCMELRRRGFDAINGDTDLAYQGDPETGLPTHLASHWHHLWHVDRVRSLIADQSNDVTFFCGGSRNSAAFLGLFDGVFVLQVDLDTLAERLDRRPGDEFGAKRPERDLILRLHRTGEDVPKDGMMINATAPLSEVVDQILARTAAAEVDPGVSVRDARVEMRVRFPVDDKALSTLHAVAFAHPAHPPPIKVEPWRDRLERHSLSWVGAFHADTLVGFVHACWDGGRHAFLLDTVVDPGYRHRGVGGFLVRQLIQDATDAGCHWLHVDFVPEVKPFYEAAGFRSTAAGVIKLN